MSIKRLYSTYNKQALFKLLHLVFREIKFVLKKLSFSPSMRCSVKKGVLKKACNFVKKRLRPKCFPVNIAKFLKTAFFIGHLWLVPLPFPFSRKDFSNLELIYHTMLSGNVKLLCFNRSVVSTLEIQLKFVIPVIYYPFKTP